MRRKKSITIPHTQHRTAPIPTPSQPKRKNGDVRKRGDPHQEQEKVNKGKKGGKLKENKLIKLN